MLKQKQHTVRYLWKNLLQDKVMLRVNQVAVLDRTKRMNEITDAYDAP